MGGSAPLDLRPPVICGENVVIRPWRVGDAAALAAAWADPVVIAGSDPPNDRSIEAATDWILGVGDRAAAGLALDLAIADPSDDHVMGEVGVSRIEPTRRAALVGWWVGEADRGRHIATQAVGVFVEWLLEPGRLHHVLAEIDSRNSASFAVAVNAGFRVLREADRDTSAVLVRDAGSISAD